MSDVSVNGFYRYWELQTSFISFIPISLSEVLKLVIWFFDINVPFSINEMDTNIKIYMCVCVCLFVCVWLCVCLWRSFNTPRRLKIIASNGFLNSKDRMKRTIVFSILLYLMNHTYQDCQKYIKYDLNIFLNFYLSIYRIILFETNANV